MTTLVKSPNVQFLLQHPAHFFGLGFGSGLAPKAPGTFGTLIGYPLFWLISVYALSTQLIIISALFLIGIYFCGVTGKALGVSDHGGIVWDEIVAMMLVLAFTPNQWQWWIVAFLLFRLFDIWKPFPIRQFDAKLKNGFGVMFDDLLAAIYAIIGLQGLQWAVAHG
ncbi:phosphatidylglycerophosphatase A [Methylotenera sp.]|uniref:phosphatidylglycerophosphatase A family protein n=1 Tax=Methylotenera sp. TaxID=2051956 RepID=UPI00248A4B63|nr:phosphatidylglycerophosphatase A [Methylotenera sp.]MDI1360482.1 phosphatidylglycerophosphatase A [Methylotenera sp.]